MSEKFQRYEPDARDREEIDKCPNELAKFCLRTHFELEHYRQSGWSPQSLARFGGVHWATREMRRADDFGPAHDAIDAGFRLGLKLAEQILSYRYRRSAGDLQ